MIVINAPVTPSDQAKVQKALNTLASKVKANNLKFLEDVCHVTDPNKLIEDMKKEHGAKVKLGKAFKF